jgi:hypothetical protein
VTDDPKAGSEAGDVSGPDLIPQAHGGALRPPWKKGESGNPGGRPGGAFWWRGWCRKYLVNRGAAIIAKKADEGDPYALRIIVQGAGFLVVLPEDTNGDGPDDWPADLDVTRADDATTPPPAPRKRSAREIAEAEVLEDARRESPGPLHIPELEASGLGLSPQEFARRVAERIKRGGG